MERLKPPARLSSPRDWSMLFPDDYLREYYSSLAPDEKKVLQYLVGVLRTETSVNGRFMDFGCGPVVSRAIAAVPRVSEINFADLLPANLQAIRRWVDREPGHFEWDDYTRYVLQLEGSNEVSQKAILDREDRIRERLGRLIPGDAAAPDPLGPEHRGGYDLVMCCFCLETVGQTRKDFVQALRNVLTLVAPGGLAVVMSLAHCSAYRLDGVFATCYPADPTDVSTGFQEAGFGSSLRIQVEPVPDHANQGYTEMIFAHARR